MGMESRGAPSTFSESTRGTSNVVGFVLAFALVITAFTIYQSDVVPHQNERIEYEHNQEMEGEFGKLRETAEDVTVAGSPRSVTLRAGPQYPARAMAVNGPKPVGEIRTGDARDVRIRGFQYESGDIWQSGTTTTYTTRLVYYEPHFNYHQEASSYVLENGRTVERFANDGGGRHVGGTVVTGNRIDLLLLEGDIRRTGQTVDLELKPVSTGQGYLTVEAVDGQSTRLELPTTMSKSHWESTVADNSNVSVGDYDATAGTVNLSFDPGTYRLRIRKATFESASDPAVHTVTKGNDPAAKVGETVTVEAIPRDEYGNRLTDVNVTFNETNEPNVTVSSGEDGVARYRTQRINVHEDVQAVVQTPSGNETVSFSLGPGEPLVLESDNAMYRGVSLDEFRLKFGAAITTTSSTCVLGLDGSVIGLLTCTEETYDGIEIDLGIRDGGDFYRVRILLQDLNQDGDFTDDRLLSADDTHLVYIEKNGNDVVEHELTDAATNAITTGTGTDLLDASNYDGSPSTGQISVDDGDLVINEINGRVQAETNT